MTRVLLIEDDRDLAETLLQLMEFENMVPDYASNGSAGLNLAQTNRYDVLVIDIGLPKMDGLSLCKQLRQEGCQTPILFLTARGSIDDKLEGFASGGDDYLAKPFDNRELLARIMVLSGRRSSQSPVIKIDNLELDNNAHQVNRGEHTIKLTPASFTILEVLMRASPNVVSREDLESALWGDDAPNSNTLKAHIYYLRKSLEQAPGEKLLHTIAGKGWVIKPE
ncbi:response regulator transcription factor [Photobacterium sanguinicancri]|uniref:response regulator transcription factor n=1 Tax=Photobacterium sanguinicancri TaxID=875932 RepID=UPI0026E3E3B1|nr:response regulator transcription factor [Photobacterium sanguinicancri]MDO6496774.1 response regulator transcription factor [Photobacterium sanguinicancri]